MKKQISLLFVAICLVVTSCRHHRGNITIAFKESNHYYSMNANFSEDRTREVEYYMDRRIGRRSSMSFINTRIDGVLSFDDHSSFYIKKYPGYLQIKLDKDQNSVDAYEQVRDMCQGIKHILENKNAGR